MAQPIGVAIIGSGLFVKAEHLPAVLGNAKLGLKALYSRSLKSAQETASQIKDAPAPDLYSDDSPGSTYADLLQRGDIQALVIALPIVSQPSYVQAALAAGKHVLAEKPIAKDIATAQALISFHDNLPPATPVQQVQQVQQAQQVQQVKPIFAVGENLRFDPRFLYAAEQARALGNMTHFSAKVLGLMRPDNKYYKTSWRAAPAYQGGFLLDGGVHHAAATRMFLSGPGNTAASVRAFTRLAQSHLGPVDTVTAIVRSESGATGTYCHSAGSLASAFEWEVVCERGAVRVDGEVVTVVKDGDGGSVERVERRFARTSGVRDELDAWAGSILEGRGEVVPRQSAREALGDLEFLESMFASGAEGGEARSYVLQRW